MGWKFDWGKKKVAAQAVTPSGCTRNDDVRRALTEHGDDGVAVRHVVHYAYPLEGADLSRRDEIAAHLKSEGFDVSDAASNDGFVFEHYRSVAPGDFDKFTNTLEDWFSGRGWDYDGWECAIVPQRH